MTYEGYEDAEKLKDDLKETGEQADKTTTQLTHSGQSAYRTGMQYRMLAMSTMSAVTSIAMLAGASKEQMKALQVLNAVIGITITLWTILDIVSGGGAMAGGAGIKAASRAMQGISGGARVMSTMHQGGYGSDQLAMIQSNERVVPSYRIMTNYGGNISIGTMVLQGGSGKDLARDFTEQLESYKQRGVMTPDWG
jgi:hypothetical protein